jgi:RNA polymerase sigma-70 factor (ECF subfamily)
MRRRSLAEARRVLGDWHAADDVAQEAILRAWRSWSAGARPDCALAWVCTITRNEAARWRGSRGARTWAATAADPEVNASTDATEELLLDRIAVRAVLAALDDEERLLIQLRYTEDLTHEEVGRRIGAAEGTAKVRLHRLRKRLREILEP